MILATLLMRDEEEIVREHLEHHLSHGVDAFVVTLHRSSDRTRDVLRDYPQVLEVYERTDETYDQSKWVTRMARDACRFNPDWIVHLDADEFWQGLEWLRSVKPDVGLVKVNRVHTHQPEPGLVYGRFRRDQMPRFRREPYCKVIHLPSTRIKVHQGNHGVDGHRGRMVETDQVRIDHYPIRSYGHFEKKVVQGGRAYAASTELPMEMGCHWRQWYEMWLLDPAMLREAYDRLLPRDADRWDEGSGKPARVSSVGA